LKDNVSAPENTANGSINKLVQSAKRGAAGSTSKSKKEKIRTKAKKVVR